MSNDNRDGGTSKMTTSTSMTLHPHPQSLLGNGHPSSLKSLSRDTNTELVLCAYVHLTGLLFLLPPLPIVRTSALSALQSAVHAAGEAWISVLRPLFPTVIISRARVSL